MQNINKEPAPSRLDLTETEAGGVLVSNYPPYSFLSEDKLPEAVTALNSKPDRDNTLGLYLHIPFCRRRCKFCYYLVFTDKNSAQIETYLNALSREVTIYSEREAVQDRPLKFV